MSLLLVVEPMVAAAIGASRGTGVANLLTPDPKEVWADSEAGTAAYLTIDLGAVRTFDTVFLGSVHFPDGAATWEVHCGVAGGYEVSVTSGPLRVPDVPGHVRELSHALWHGAAQTARYVSLILTQPAGSSPLTAGVVVIGKAFVAQLGQEWGSGRQPVDTGAATALPSGGFSVVEGARKVLFSWTFGDLSIEEADRLEQIGLALGETHPGLVVEDPARTASLRSRIHYGLFKRWRAFERRNRRQTRWEMAIEQWI